MLDHFLPKLVAPVTGFSIILAIAGCGQKSDSDAPLPGKVSATESTMTEELTGTQKIHLTLGYSIGDDIMLNSYTDDEVKQIIAGMRLASTGDKPDYVDDLKDSAFQILNEKASRRAAERQESEGGGNKGAGEAFLKTIDGKAGVIKTASGLRYEMLTEGSDKHATAADSVSVHYEGKLIDGTIFDSSIQRGEPVTFPLNGVIKGFSEGLTFVGEGGKIRLYMPSDIAYGDRGAGGAIGPGATLIFEVELLNVNP